MPKHTGIYKKESGVYKFQNINTGKFYIGSSKDLYKRQARLRYVLKKGLKENVRMQLDCDEYGINSFVFGVVEYCDENKLLEREQFYFELWKPEYNVWKSVYSAKDRTYTNEQIKYFKSYKHSPKDFEKHSNSLKEAWKRRKEKFTPEELSKKMSDARKGIKHSEETKQKYRETRKGKKKSPETKEKMRLSKLGTKLINGKFVKF